VSEGGPDYTVVDGDFFELFGFPASIRQEMSLKTKRRFGHELLNSYLESKGTPIRNGTLLDEKAMVAYGVSKKQ